MKVGIIGSGGREHSLCTALKKSKKIDEIYCFPGNAGTRLIAKNIDINIDKFEDLKKFILDKNIEIIVIGPEKPLVNGLKDFLVKNNIKVFGPDKVAAQLEGSKIFTKKSENILRPEDFGVIPTKPESISGGKDISSSVKIFMDIIKNKGTDAQNNVVCANAGMAISTVLKVSHIEGFEKAKESLESGKALKSLIKLQDLSKK